MINDSCSFRTNLISFRTFRCPLFPGPVFWLGLFFAVSLQQTGSSCSAVIRYDVFLVLRLLLHFVAFFHVASLFSIRVDNENALEVDNRIFFSHFSLISKLKYHPKMQQNILLQNILA